MLEKLKGEVLKGNLDLVRHNLVVFTWGNVSGIDHETGYVVIKPSGVKYEELAKEMMVVVDLEGTIIEGDLKPSSDTATHLELYKAFPNIKGIVHTHSKWATIYSQAKQEILPFGTTHADYFAGTIPVTRSLTSKEIKTDYEKNTGKIIVETFLDKNIDSIQYPGVLVAEHGPFSFGTSVDNAVHNAVVLEYIAEMAYYTESLNGKNEMNEELLSKHFNRKNGKNSYYGQ